MTSKSRPVSEGEFNEWRESVVTKQFFDLLLREAHIRRQIMADGITADSTYEVGERYLRLRSIAETYEGIPSVNYEDFLEDTYDADSRSGISSTD